MKRVQTVVIIALIIANVVWAACFCAALNHVNMLTELVLTLKSNQHELVETQEIVTEMLGTLVSLHEPTREAP